MNVADPLTQIGLYPGHTSNALPIHALNGQFADDDAKLGAFLFPRYSPQATFSWRRLSSAEVGMRLMSSLVNARNLPQHGFTWMMGIARQISAYELEYGGFDYLPADFADLLERELATEVP